ncbi:MAG: Na+/H+ antiporter subunit E [Bacteroidales bacterium]|nr:Na+/H+ antiporter subunit E [Bacteroidales bacterium]
MKNIISFVFLVGLWLLLTYNISVANIIVGAVMALITVLFFGKYFVSSPWKVLHPRRIFWFVVYLFIFLWECIRANFDVAYRVLHPAMPIKPGIVKVKTGLKTSIAKTILANSITMTPGTITVDLIDDDLYVHWIYVHSIDPETYSRQVSGRFEKYIKKIFE